jgi:short-subunit dehydrogenase
MKKILIVGATSAIAESVARRYAAQGAALFLLGRNVERLEVIAGDLRNRGAEKVWTDRFEAGDFDSFEGILVKAFKQAGGFDVVLVAYGTLGDQQACERSLEETVRELQTNAVGTIALLTLLARMMEVRKHGTIAVISSVAGDRGRPSNYVYGSAKAAVTTFCEGLRGRLFRSGVHLLTVKPGMVDTPMTGGMELPKLLLARPEQVAGDIVAGIEKGWDVLYTPWYWRYVMTAIVHIPVKIFRKLPL